jgi:phosphoribosylformylglycinamidine synthase
MAITNCLNFGNPYKPEMYYQFAECVRGMGEACRVFNTPVTGGNVSFYNEDPERAVYPTPTIGMIGKIEDLKFITTGDFKAAGDGVALLGTTHDELGGSEYLKSIHGQVTGHAPALDLDAEVRLQQFLVTAIRSGWIKSAHDCSDGGLAVALFESCIGADDKLWGVDIDFSESPIRADSLLFGESQSRIVISFDPDYRVAIEKSAVEQDVPFEFIGSVTDSDRFVLTPHIDQPINKLRTIHLESLTHLMDEIKTAAVA